MSLNISLFGELSEEKLEEVLLRDVLKARGWGDLLHLWNWCWFLDGLGLGDSNLSFLRLHNHWALDDGVVIWRNCRSWEEWGTGLELSRVDILLLVSSTKEWLSHVWKLVG